MRWFRSIVSGLGAGLLFFAAGSAQAGVFELIYWGDGHLDWFQLDGVSYTVDADSVSIKDIYAGSHTISFSTNGNYRSYSLYLSAQNATSDDDYWCLDLENDHYEILDDWDCEDMWDYYMFGD